jgi:hypothetical protein
VVSPEQSARELRESRPKNGEGIADLMIFRGQNMKVAFSVLVGSAMAVAAAGAQAADLPTRKAAPAADYVRVCNAFGAGFFVIPGADTCIKLGGVVRYEANYRANAPGGSLNQFAYNLAGQTYSRDDYYERSREYLNVDIRDQTAYGELKAYMSLRYTQDTLPPGPFGGGKIATPTTATTGIKLNAGLFQGLGSQQFYVDAGYVQWAGLTAGVAHSFYDFYSHGYEIESLTMGGSDQPLTLVGYTAKFGGFSASVSAEDPTARRIGDSTADIGIAQNNPKNTTTAAYLTYGAVKMPEFVGNLRYDGAWGSLQLSGALHDVNSAPIFGCSSAGSGGINCGNVGDKYTLPIGYTPSSVLGFAVQGGAKIKLDSISPGDSVTAQVSYAQGAIDYVNAVNYYNGTTNTYGNGLSIGIPVNDAFVLPNGSVGLSKATGIFAGGQHFWVPTVRSALFGSYMQVINPSAAQLFSAGADNAKVWDIGFNTYWSPVKALDIGAELMYTNLNLSGANSLLTVAPNCATLTTNTCGKSTYLIPASSNDWRGRIRLQVTF